MKAPGGGLPASCRRGPGLWGARAATAELRRVTPSEAVADSSTHTCACSLASTATRTKIAGAKCESRRTGPLVGSSVDNHCRNCRAPIKRRSVAPDRGKTPLGSSNAFPSSTRAHCARPCFPLSRQCWSLRPAVSLSLRVNVLAQRWRRPLYSNVHPPGGRIESEACGKGGSNCRNSSGAPTRPEVGRLSEAQQS